MAVTVAQVRTQIADRPQLWPPSAQPPDLLGTGDGVTTIFSLRHENYIPGTLTISTAPAPGAGTGKKTTWTGVASSAYTVGAPDPGPDATAATNAIITFSAAPATGTLVGARYQVTAFSDSDLAGYLTRAQALYTDDLSVLKRVQYDLIDVLLVDRERMLLVRQGDFSEEPQAYMEALRALKAELRADLEGGPQPGTIVPAIAFGSQGARRYQPLR